MENLFREDSFHIFELVSFIALTVAKIEPNGVIPC